MRASNTESMIRIIVEAKEQKKHASCRLGTKQVEEISAA